MEGLSEAHGQAQRLLYRRVQNECAKSLQRQTETCVCVCV